MSWKKEIEYRVVWGRVDGDGDDVHFYEGSEWRTVKKLAKECKEGKHNDFDDGMRIQWIERVTRHFTDTDLWDEWEPALYSRVRESENI